MDVGFYRGITDWHTKEQTDSTLTMAFVLGELYEK